MLLLQSDHDSHLEPNVEFQALRKNNGGKALYNYNLNTFTLCH